MMNLERLQQLLEENVMIYKDIEEENDEKTIFTVTIDEDILIIKEELEESGFTYNDFTIDRTEYENEYKKIIRDISIKLANINNNYTLLEK